MKNVKILPDIQLTESDGSRIEGATLKHIKFLLDRLSDPVFTADFESLVRGMFIRNSILALGEETSLQLEDADWDKLCIACKRGYAAPIAHNFIPFIQAVLKAE